jgi:hypothetical protein
VRSRIMVIARLQSGRLRKEKCATGAAKLGSCPTDATREGHRRRVVLKFAAMPMLERLR